MNFASDTTKADLYNVLSKWHICTSEFDADTAIIPDDFGDTSDGSFGLLVKVIAIEVSAGSGNTIDFDEDLRFRRFCHEHLLGDGLEEQSLTVVVDWPLLEGDLGVGRTIVLIGVQVAPGHFPIEVDELDQEGLG